MRGLGLWSMAFALLLVAPAAWATPSERPVRRPAPPSERPVPLRPSPRPSARPAGVATPRPKPAARPTPRPSAAHRPAPSSLAAPSLGPRERPSPLASVAPSLGPVGGPSPGAGPQVPGGPRLQQSALQLTWLPRGRGLQLGALLVFEAPAAGVGQVRLRLHPAMRVRSALWGDRRAGVRREGELLSLSHPGGASWALRLELQGRPALGGGRQLRQDAGPEAWLLRPEGLWWPQPEAGPEGAVSLSWRLPAGWVAGVPGLAPGATRGLLPPGQPLAFAARPGRWQQWPGLQLAAEGQPSEAEQGQLRAMARLGWLPPRPQQLVALPEGWVPLRVGQLWRAQPWPLAGGLAAELWRPAEGPAAGWLKEGLAAYLADWAEALGQEEAEARSQALEAARQRRLERYLHDRAHLSEEPPTAALVDPKHPAWGVVVRERGALLWHLLARQLGEERLRQLLVRHQEGGPRPASVAQWVEAAGPEAAFIVDWLAQAGLPTLSWRQVRWVQAPFQPPHLEATLVQQPPTFPLRVPVSLVCEEGVVQTEVEATGIATPLRWSPPSKPLRLVMDPGEALPLRRRPHLRLVEALHAPGLVIAYGSGASAEEARANQELAKALSERLGLLQGARPPVRADGALSQSERQGPLVLVGRPEGHALAARWADQLPVRFIEGRALWWQGRTYQAPSIGILEAIANPEAPDHAVVLIAGLSPQAAQDALLHLNANASFVVYEGASVLDQGLALRPFPDLDHVFY